MAIANNIEDAASNEIFDERFCSSCASSTCIICMMSDAFLDTSNDLCMDVGCVAVLGIGFESSKYLILEVSIFALIEKSN